MDDAMRAEFEENGYLLLRGVLDAETLTSLNQTFDEHIQTDSEDRGSRIRVTQATFQRETRQVTDRHGNRYEGKRFWSDGYRSLIDHPRVLPILRELLGQPELGRTPQPCIPCPSCQFKFGSRISQPSSPLQPAPDVVGCRTVGRECQRLPRAPHRLRTRPQGRPR